MTAIFPIAWGIALIARAFLEKLPNPEGHPTSYARIEMQPGGLVSKWRSPSLKRAGQKRLAVNSRVIWTKNQGFWIKDKESRIVD